MELLRRKIAPAKNKISTVGNSLTDKIEKSKMGDKMGTKIKTPSGLAGQGEDNQDAMQRIRQKLGKMKSQRKENGKQ